MSILEVKNVSIRYMTGDSREIGLKEYILQKLQGKYHPVEFWADKNISFTLEKGDMLGIIGTNGAGKSTLLKCISGILEPTKGTVKRNGNIAALLELGSGFDGDLTVKENTYLRGALLGYSRSFMDETYDSIIRFAELKEFENRPFKHLSTGMRSRLAFSIASLVKPDILILDEVLAVGDGAFRKKSEAKMREIINGGTTTLFVGHSLGQIRAMCNKVLWLDKGEQIAFGSDVKGICDRYQRHLQMLAAREGASLNLRVINRKSGKPFLEWNKIPGAVRYEIYVATKEDGIYERWRDARIRGICHGDAEEDVTYYYKMRALFNEDGSEHGEFSPVASGRSIEGKRQ